MSSHLELQAKLETEMLFGLERAMEGLDLPSQTIDRLRELCKRTCGFIIRQAFDQSQKTESLVVKPNREIVMPLGLLHTPSPKGDPLGIEIEADEENFSQAIEAMLSIGRTIRNGNSFVGSNGKEQSVNDPVSGDTLIAVIDALRYRSEGNAIVVLE